MYGECLTSEFDVLTEGTEYLIHRVENNSYQIQCDDGVLRWFGQVNFRIDV